MSSQYEKEQQILSFVVRAVSRFIVTTLQSPQKSSVTGDDCSPYPLLKYAAQVFMTGLIRSAFPADAFVAEITDSFLRLNPRKACDVAKLLKDENSAYQLFHTNAEMVDILELGRGNVSASGGRVWVLNAIDNVLDVAKGKRFTTSASLFVDGQNMAACVAASTAGADESGLQVFHAAKGQGAWDQTFTLYGQYHCDNQISVTRRHDQFGLPPRPFASAQPANALHTDDVDHDNITQRLDCRSTLHLSSATARYIAVATALVDSTFHIPRSPTDHFNIWEHAAGSLIAAEAGAKVTDANGLPLDFTASRQLSNNFGLAVAPWGNAHWRLLDAIADTCSRRGKRDSGRESGSVSGSASSLSSGWSGSRSVSRRTSLTSIWSSECC